MSTYTVSPLDVVVSAARLAARSTRTCLTMRWELELEPPPAYPQVGGNPNEHRYSVHQDIGKGGESFCQEISGLQGRLPDHD